MSDPRTGGCQCGHVRYRITGRPIELTACHCRACQRQSGSAFGMSLHLPEAAFALVSGRLATFEVTTDGGRIKTCAFCPNCGARIHHATAGGLSLKAGTLDDTTGLAPDAHYWTACKQPWVVIPAGVPQIEDDG